jgi:hypothetical protein
MLIEKRARQDALGPSSPQLMTKPCPVVPVVQSLHLNKVRASDQPCCWRAVSICSTAQRNWAVLNLAKDLGCFSVLWQKAPSPPRGQANHPPVSRALSSPSWCPAGRCLTSPLAWEAERNLPPLGSSDAQGRMALLLPGERTMLCSGQVSGWGEITGVFIVGSLLHLFTVPSTSVVFFFPG